MNLCVGMGVHVNNCMFVPFVHVCVHVCVCHLCIDDYGGQKRASHISLEQLEVQAVMGHLKKGLNAETGSSKGAPSTLECRSIFFQAPGIKFKHL